MNISEVDLHKLTVSDPFLGQYQQLVRDVVIPLSVGCLETIVSQKRNPAMRLKTFALPQDCKTVNFTGWCFRTATSPNGWKR